MPACPSTCQLSLQPDCVVCMLHCTCTNSMHVQAYRPSGSLVGWHQHTQCNAADYVRMLQSWYKQADSRLHTSCHYIARTRFRQVGWIWRGRDGNTFLVGEVRISRRGASGHKQLIVHCSCLL